jgi:hypothetical protein
MSRSSKKLGSSKQKSIKSTVEFGSTESELRHHKQLRMNPVGGGAAINRNQERTSEGTAGRREGSPGAPWPRCSSSCRASLFHKSDGQGGWLAASSTASTLLQTRSLPPRQCVGTSARPFHCKPSSSSARCCRERPGSSATPRSPSPSGRSSL